MSFQKELDKENYGVGLIVACTLVALALVVLLAWVLAGI